LYTSLKYNLPQKIAFKILMEDGVWHISDCKICWPKSYIPNIFEIEGFIFLGRYVGMKKHFFYSSASDNSLRRAGQRFGSRRIRLGNATH
jgi:hypothetical protein